MGAKGLPNHLGTKPTEVAMREGLRVRIHYVFVHSQDGKRVSTSHVGI